MPGAWFPLRYSPEGAATERKKAPPAAGALPGAVCAPHAAFSGVAGFCPCIIPPLRKASEGYTSPGAEAPKHAKDTGKLGLAPKSVGPVAPVYPQTDRFGNLGVEYLNTVGAVFLSSRSVGSRA